MISMNRKWIARKQKEFGMEKILQRFHSSYEKAVNGCWNWTASLSSGGYGSFYYSGRSYIASRVSWEFHGGKISNGLCILHKCDNPKCVNPDHLFLGTNADNTADMFKKGRNKNIELPHPCGENHPCAKLTAAKVQEIRYLYDNGKHQRAIGFIFGVSGAHISRIVQRKAWGHI